MPGQASEFCSEIVTRAQAEQGVIVPAHALHQVPAQLGVQPHLLAEEPLTAKSQGLDFRHPVHLFAQIPVDPPGDQAAA